jgi:hypothetical protein
MLPLPREVFMLVEERSVSVEDLGRSIALYDRVWTPVEIEHSSPLCIQQIKKQHKPAAYMGIHAAAATCINLDSGAMKCAPIIPLGGDNQKQLYGLTNTAPTHGDGCHGASHRVTGE